MTFVADSLLFRLAYILRLLPQDKKTHLWGFWRVVLVSACASLTVYEDYRLNIRGLLFALAGFSLLSLSKVVTRIGPRIEPKGTQTWVSPFQISLLAGIPTLVLAGFATSKLENVVAASQIARSWSFTTRVMNIGPGILLHILFSSPMNSAFPFVSQDHVGGALEETSEGAREAVTTTLQAGFWVLVVGVLGRENNLVDWIQVIAFTVVYVACVGVRHIAYYPPRILNIITRVLRRRQLPVHAEPWQFPVFLITTTTVFAILISSNTMYWVDTIAYNRNLKTWLGPDKVILDTLYRPPQLRSFDIIIAHSEGDSLDSITELVQSFSGFPAAAGLNPHVIVYTKDPTFNLTESTAEVLKGTFEGDLSLQTLRNTGGVTGTFLHHILYAWDFLPVQTLFLTTTPSLPNSKSSDLLKRFNENFIPPGFPLPDALPKTGFLNLGEQESCWCGACSDSLGWEDTFHLIPSMWSAARPGSPKCDSVLLTYGNNFLASAARIRGLKKDVWELLYDALKNEDMGNAWAHNSEKLPKMLEGEQGLGRWEEGAVFGREDSVRNPWFGLTVERLWGVLLQCSEGYIAWRCPDLEIGWRRGGVREDCGCIE